MAIEITEFANVSIAVSPVGVQGGNFGILGFLTNEEGVVSVAERARAYTSLASVLADWAGTTEVAKAATAFYGQTPTPTDFVVQMCFETAQPATLTGGAHDDLATLVGNITGSGALSITIDGTLVEVTTLDLSGVADLDAAAVAIEASITAANGAAAICDVSHTGKQFEVVSLTTGVASTITFGEGTAAEYLGLAQHQARKSDGIAVESPVTALGVALAMGIQTVGLVTHKKYRDVISGGTGETTLEIAQWAEASKRIFCNTTNALVAMDSQTTTDVGSVLKAASLRFSLTSFSKNSALYPSASVFGRAASVNFSGIGAALTLNLKQMPGITAENLSPGEFAALRGKNISAVVQIGKSINAYTDSRMANGSWLDTTHGLMWLENRAETDMFNLLYQSSTKVPYTQAGINSTVSTLDRSLQAAVRNGLCGPGFLSDGTYLPEGYDITAVELADVSAGDKSNRIYKGLSFRMVGAGALHEVEVSGSFAE